MCFGDDPPKFLAPNLQIPQIDQSLPECLRLMPYFAHKQPDPLGKSVELKGILFKIHNGGSSLIHTTG